MAELRVDTEDGGTIELSEGGVQVLARSRLFLLEVDGETRTELTEPAEERADGVIGLTGRIAGTGLAVRWVARELAGGDVWELSVTLSNEGTGVHRVTRMDPLTAQLVAANWDALHFRSAWGSEFSPDAGPLGDRLHLECRSGRSAHGHSPWLGLQRPEAGLVVAPAWSGNWHIDVDAAHLSAGISPWHFFIDLEPGQQVAAPSVVLATGADREAAAVRLTTAVGAGWVPRSAASEALEVEWNHWWPYEDVEVNEEVIWQNSRIAAGLGVGVSTVDAGWFGDSDADSDWQVQRGDWHHTNAERFPSGLAKLGDGIRQTGLKAGIWMEAEAVGSAAELRRTHPEIMAYAPGDWKRDDSYRLMTVSIDEDDPAFLGYVCLGSPAGREHVARSMDTAVREMGAEWIKLDFNIDPDRGCTRTDHGHGAGDGLFRHYEGLYSVLDDFRAAHPEVILESCASGGLRVDLGLARHVHCFFLSDPDYTEHHLQVLWGTSLLIPPVAMLHWSWSQWRGDYPPSQLDFGALTPGQFDTMLRAAMLHRFGFSLRLPELTAEQLESLARHTALFTETIAPLVRSGVLHRLTAQPLGDGGGERSPVFQLSCGRRHLLAAFRLQGGESPTALRPRGLPSAEGYTATDLATGLVTPLGAEGVVPDTTDPDVSSWLVLVEPSAGH